MTYRLCARLGCDEPLTSRHANARYCSDACKSAAYKARTGYTLHATREPCQTRKSSGGPSGLQVSYRKAVEVLADFLTHEREVEAPMQRQQDTPAREHTQRNQRRSGRGRARPP